MTKDEGLKLALEALEGVLDNSPKVLDASISGGLYEVVQCRDAITAIKEALAQPELCKYGQEPKSCTSSPMDCQCAIEAALAQPEQEPSYWLGYGLQAHTEKPFDDATPLYTTPPQRPWVGLTNNELQPIADEYRILFGSWVEDFARAIEAKLREKNS
ncbi:hypothetical protein UFOVP924_60 [uncultured Caudovirales phage]|uniref:Uncharacterized protein n=1 Tax=uncultured Caudovirales phage TaxID=2100421 RepID=A0A6J5RW88_9CAUD|nr:hypothetical protein UFOVP924_60 [uncultured Caudovirales phage]CAB4200190.1 hypothetical protein UFOVP1348_31 [uncultured Caudovirales phage]